MDYKSGSSLLMGISNGNEKWVLSKWIQQILENTFRPANAGKMFAKKLKRQYDEMPLEDKLSYQLKLDNRNEARQNYCFLRSRFKI